MATKQWTGNALAISQIQTYAPGPQLPNTTITATVNGKTVSYTSTTGTNDDLVSGLLTAANGITRLAPEFAEIAWTSPRYSPAVPSPNSLYLQMASQVAGVPFTVQISLSQPAKASVTRLVAGRKAVNEVQQITISPNAESGSYFQVKWNGGQSNYIPTPPSPPTFNAFVGSGALTGNYYWVVTFETATGETEPSAASAQISPAAQNVTLNVPLGPSASSVTQARVVYRTLAGAPITGPYYKVARIADNSTTTYTDSSTDATIKLNPNPPTTNGVLQGELEAVGLMGAGNVKVGGANTAAVVGMTMPTKAIVYTIEFMGTLGGAQQLLTSGIVTSVAILPPVSVTQTQAGSPPQNEIQVVGWQQVVGTVAPTGTITITLRGLNVTTSPITVAASAATVQAALVAAAGPAYANAFNVVLSQSTNAGVLWQITYQGPLALSQVPLATVDVSKATAAVGDTVTAYQLETQIGTPTGFNSIATVTISNGPSGGTWGLSMGLSNGNTITATGIAFNASAATVQAAFPANTISVSGVGGGPYTVEALGEAGGQVITWSATSSLTTPLTISGSPPATNTAGVDPPAATATPGTVEGSLASGTYYYAVTAVNANGETTSNAIATGVTGPDGYVALNWSAIPTATGYNVYRGSASNAINTKIANTTGTQYNDYGGVNKSLSPPTSNGTVLTPPLNPGTASDLIIDARGYTGQNAGQGVATAPVAGSLAAGMYYYKVTAYNAAGETVASQEVTGQTSLLTGNVTGQPFVQTIGTAAIAVQWSTVAGATGYKIYRGTVSGSENTLVATIASQAASYFLDTGPANTAASPPGSNSSTVNASPSWDFYQSGANQGVTVSAAAPANGGNWSFFQAGTIGSSLAAGTYYYKVTCYDAGGESLPGPELAITVTAGQVAVLAFSLPYLVHGFKIYRGTTPGAENTLIANLSENLRTGQPYVLDCVYVDSGGTATAATPPVANTTGIAAPVASGVTDAGASGALAGATYYYEVTATTVVGETNPSNEVNTAISSQHQARIAWAAVTGATGYNVYRGTSTGAEKVLVGVLTDGTETAFHDTGPVNTAVAPPTTNTATIAAPTQSATTPSASGGSLASGTYYYVVTAYTKAGETTKSNEQSAAVTGPTGQVTVAWTADSGADGYKIYRGTATTQENALAGVVAGGSTTSFVDTGTVQTATYTAAELVVGSAAVNEQQLITLTGATGGTFSLAYEGQGTPGLPFNDTAADVQAKLQALSTIGVNNLTVTGSAGGPFTATGAGALAGTPLPLLAANSPALLGSTIVAQGLTTTQSPTGPNWWTDPNNWSPTGVPASGDSVYFANSTVDCLYGLAQPGTVLANLQIDMSFVNGWIGLPSWNGKYYEYRPQYLQIGVSGTILIGNGQGSGPTLLKIDTGANPVSILVNNCGKSTDPTVPAIIWKGNRTSGTTTINVSKGAIGIAIYAGEAATVDQINQGYVTNVKADSSVYVGPGTTINTQWYMTGGQGTLNANCPNLLMENGALTVLDGLAATAVTTLAIIGGTVSDRSTGLIATLTVGTGATYDRSDDSRAKTVTNTTIYGKSTFLDPNTTITFTNPLLLSNCSLLDVTIDLGTNRHLQRT